MNPFLFIDIPFNSPDAWGAFQIAHGLTHQTVYEALLKRNLIPLYYPLMDFPREDNKPYLLDHWETHRSNAQLLGLSDVPDLATVDLSDPSQFDDWLQVHALVHRNENLALGLS